MGLTIDGLISQLDTTELVKKLIEIERAPVRLMQRQQAELQNQINVWLELNTRVLALKGMVGTLKQPSAYQVFQASSSDETIVKATATSAATPATYDLVVKQLAQAHSVASDALSTSTTDDPLSTRLSPGFATDQTFSITVNNVTTNITVSTTDTLNDLKNLINDSGAAVTASVIKDTPNTERLVLTSKNTGASNAMSFTDSVDGILTQLGILSATVQENFNDGFADGLPGLVVNGGTWAVSPSPGAPDPTNVYNGTGPGTENLPRDSATFTEASTDYLYEVDFEVVTDGTTSSAPLMGLMLRRVDNSNFVQVRLRDSDAGAPFAPVIDFHIQEGGVDDPDSVFGVSIPDYRSGTGVHSLVVRDTGSTITITLDGTEVISASYDTGVAAGSKGFAVSGDASVNFDNVFVRPGSGIKNELTAAQDAQFDFNGLSITRSSNTVSDLVTGVTFNLLQVDPTPASPVTVTVSRDTQAVQTTIQNFVEQYNSLIRFFQEQNFFNEETGESGLLIGDPQLVQLEFLLQQTTFATVDTTKVSELIGIGDGSRGVLFGQFALANQVATLSDIAEITVEGERFEVRAEGEALGIPGSKRVEVRTNGELRFIDEDGSLLAIPDGEVIRATYRPGELVGTGDGSLGATLGDFSLDFPVRSASDVRGILLRDGVNDRFVSVVGRNQAKAGQEVFEVDAETGQLRYFDGTAYAAVPAGTDIVASYSPSSGPRSLRSLSDLGISTIDLEDRQLQIDSGTLSGLLLQNPEGVENVFRASAEAVAERLGTFLDFVTRSANGYISGVTEGLTDKINGLQQSINQKEEILKVREKQLFDLFNRMEVALGIAQAQQQFLLQQIQRLPTSMGSLGRETGGLIGG